MEVFLVSGCLRQSRPGHVRAVSNHAAIACVAYIHSLHICAQKYEAPPPSRSKYADETDSFEIEDFTGRGVVNATGFDIGAHVSGVVAVRYPKPQSSMKWG